jgi:hypothetical protein
MQAITVIAAGLLTAIGVLVAVVAAAAFTGLVDMLAWNFIVPTLFQGPTITFVQGVAVSLLLSVIYIVLNQISKALRGKLFS